MRNTRPSCDELGAIPSTGLAIFSLALAACAPAVESAPVEGTASQAPLRLDAQDTGVELVLVDAATDEDIRELVDNDVIGTGLGASLSLRADVQAFAPDGASVLFFVDGERGRIENFAPYALEGDASGDFAPWALGLGTHQVSALVFNEPNAQGSLILSRELTFTLADQGPLSRGVELILVGTNSNTDLQVIEDGAVIDSAAFSEPLTVRAAIVDPDFPTGSVVFFSSDGIERTENFPPFSFSGDAQGDFAPWDLSPGTQLVSALVFVERNGEGSFFLSAEATFELR